MKSIPTKRCAKCGNRKQATVEFFPSKKRGGARLESQCRECAPTRGGRQKIDAHTVDADGLKLCSGCLRRLPASPVVFGKFNKTKGWPPKCLACERLRRKDPARGTPPSGGRLMADGTKWCSLCKTYKPADTAHFARFKDSPSGYAYHCKACSRSRGKSMRAANAGNSKVATLSEKKCSACSECFPATEEYFYPTLSNRIGLTPKCRECIKAERRVYVGENADAVRESKLEYGERTREATNLRRRTERLADPEPDRARQRQTRLSKVFSTKIYGLRRRVARDAPWSEIPLTYLQLKAIYEAQGGRCAYCSIELSRVLWEPDHVTPLSRQDLNPTNGPENIACACKKCNRNKSSRTLDEWYGRWYRLLPSTAPSKVKNVRFRPLPNATD